jgi:hypothetical protein
MPTMVVSGWRIIETIPSPRVMSYRVRITDIVYRCPVCCRTLTRSECSEVFISRMEMELVGVESSVNRAVNERAPGCDCLSARCRIGARFQRHTRTYYRRAFNVPR